MFSLPFLPTSAEQLEAATTGKMQFCLHCLWLQSARCVPAQSDQHYDLVGCRLLAAQSVSGTWKWSFSHDTHSVLALSGSDGYKRENCTFYLLDPASFFHPTHAYGRAQGRGFIPFPRTLMIYCHDNSPLSRGLGEPCELVSPEYILPAVEDGCQTFAEQKGMPGILGSHQML